MKLVGKRCQCPACGEIFSTESNFIKHRRGKYIDNTRHCVNPESVGLHKDPHGVWRGPPRDTK